MAQDWINTHPSLFEQGRVVNFAIALRAVPSAIAPGASGELCGAIGLAIDAENNHAELGYWIGKPHWGQGYCTEAGTAVVRYGFEVLGLHRIHSAHFSHNPASGRVMQKIGMRYEGCRRQHIRKWENFEDLVQYGILKSDWLQLSKEDKK